MSNRIQQNPLENPWTYNRESFGTLAQIIIAMVEANGNFYRRQIEAAEAATTENSRQLRSLLKKTGEISTALEQWSGLFQSRMENFAEINKAWSKITLATLTEMNELLGSSLPVSTGAKQKKQKAESPIEATPAARATPAAPLPAGERRFMATMIAFPERRAAMLAKAEAKNAGARSHGNASARRSA